MRRKLSYKIERPIYNLEELRKDFPEEQLNFDCINSIKYKLQCKRRSLSAVLRLIIPLPFILASFYTSKFLLLDFLAGLTMAVFHIPQGLAYGLLSGLEPVNGLYASFFPPLIYAFFGTSRHISIGTFSIMSLLSSVPVFREAKAQPVFIINNTFNSSSAALMDDYDMAKLQISISTTLLAGILQIALGIFHFGYLMCYMSDALIDGFTSAAAVHVIMSQLTNLLGFKIKAFSGIGELPFKTFMFFKNISETHLPTILLSTIAIIILLLFSEIINPLFKKKFRFPLPIQFVLVVISTIISHYAEINKRFEIKIVGPIPKGLPQPMIPDITYWYRILTDAILLALIGFVMNSSLVKVYSLKFAYEVNYNQEVIAYGLSNVFGSFFQCTMSAAALARTSVVVDIGMKSQIASLISCGMMLLILLFIGPLFTAVPKCVLSAIIIVSLTGMLKKILVLPNLWYLSKFDFFVWIVTYFSTLLLNVPFGLVFGFLFSLLTVLIRIQNPKSQILGQMPNTDIYKNIKIYKDSQEIPGIKMFRYDAPLYFANAEHFQSKVYKKTGINPHLIKKSKEIFLENTQEDPQIDFENNHVSEREDIVINKNNIKPNQLRYIIIDCSSTNYIDNVGIRILDDIYKSYSKVDIKVYFASLNSNCRDMLQRAKFAEENRDRICFLTVHDAVLSTDIYQNKVILDEIEINEM